jgi:hypothetical protein
MLQNVMVKLHINVYRKQLNIKLIVSLCVAMDLMMDIINLVDDL